MLFRSTGASHPEEWVGEAVRLGLAAIAVCDRNTLAGVVRAHVAAKTVGLRSVVGCRLAFCDGTPDVLAWPSDRAAHGRLCRLLTTGNRRAQKGDCRLELDDLLAFGTGLVLAPLPGRGALGAEAERLATTLDRLRESFGREWVRLAAQPLFGPSDRRRLAGLAHLADQAGVGLLAVGDLLHHVPERRPLADVLTSIREGVPLDGAGRRLLPNAERHLRSGEEMARLFRDHPRAVGESVALLERLTFSLDELRYEYPEEDLEGARTPQEALERLTREGARRRWPDGVPETVERALAHEFAIIGELGYAPYFLTVNDIVSFARARGILAQEIGRAHV